MGLYNAVNSLDKKTLFVYIVITLACVYVLLRVDVKLNILLALGGAYMIITYMHEKKLSVENGNENYFQVKRNAIKPTPKLADTNRELVDFIFSVQDYYVYNPEAYEEFIDNLDGFESLKNNIMSDSQSANHYYQIAENKKNNALNSFHSLIYKLPVEPLFTEKFDRAHKRLETLLNKQLNELYDRCGYYQHRDGLDVLKSPINLGPKGYNHYFDKEYTYQIY